MCLSASLAGSGRRGTSIRLPLRGAVEVRPATISTVGMFHICLASLMRRIPVMRVLPVFGFMQCLEDLQVES